MPRVSLPVKRVISGGQTGVDRGALDAALRLGIEHGGWCPRGRLAEDGTIPAQYQLQESDSPDYPVRTELNVRDADGTLILYRGRVFGGTKLTMRLARQVGKPYLAIDLNEAHQAETIRDWLRAQQIEVLNVAGPRESSAPGIAQETAQLLQLCFAPAGAEST